MSDARFEALVRLQGKSLGLGVVLAIFFGGLGLFYTSIGWGIAGLLIELAIWFIGFITFGLALAVLVPAWHVLSVIIAVVSIGNHNKRLVATMK